MAQIHHPAGNNLGNDLGQILGNDLGPDRVPEVVLGGDGSPPDPRRTVVASRHQILFRQDAALERISVPYEAS